jgi:hypothetical protein
MQRGLAVALGTAALLAAACQSTETVPPTQRLASPTILPANTGTVGASPVPIAGGCGETQAFAAPGPDAASGLSDNSWAPAAPASSEMVAYFWLPSPNLVVAHGTNGGTKVLWVSHGPPAAKLEISAHPLGASVPVVTFSFPAATSPVGNYPSDLDLPTPGCWQLDLTLGATRATLDVNVAPVQPS